MGVTKGTIGNLGSILKEVVNIKQQMQVICKDFEQISMMARGEHTLGQHIDRLLEVIGNVEEVKNLMKNVPMFEDKNIILEKANIDLKKWLKSLETRMDNIETMIKKMVEQNSNILKTVADNVSSLLNKAEQDKGQDPPTIIDNQGPSKCTRAHSKKAGNVSKVEEMKATM